jgi:hypothetical protein
LLSFLAGEQEMLLSHFSPLCSSPSKLYYYFYLKKNKKESVAFLYMNNEQSGKTSKNHSLHNSFTNKMYPVINKTFSMKASRP